MYSKKSRFVKLKNPCFQKTQDIQKDPRHSKRPKTFKKTQDIQKDPRHFKKPVIFKKTRVFQKDPCFSKRPRTFKNVLGHFVSFIQKED